MIVDDMGSGTLKANTKETVQEGRGDGKPEKATIEAKTEASESSNSLEYQTARADVISGLTLGQFDADAKVCRY